MFSITRTPLLLPVRLVVWDGVDLEVQVAALLPLLVQLLDMAA